MVKPANGKFRVTLRRGINKCLPSHKACIAGLGLRRIGHSVEVLDTPANRGLARTVSYLISVEGT